MSHPEAASQPKELGPYRLGPLLGKGGMGEVYKAFDTRLGRWVAAKRLRGDATAQARARFRHEARTLAQLAHPGIVQIFDIVEDDTGDWIVMELIDGPTLAELRRGGPFDMGLTLDYARQIASALEAAHANGIVHRDLKINNVMVLPSGHAGPGRADPGRVKVLDFGLARHVTSTDAAVPEGSAVPLGGSRGGDTVLSLSGHLLGTPRTMSPEQAAGASVDTRSDLFSFGVLLFEILTGRSPFRGRTVDETIRRVINHRPPAARQLAPRVPRELSELVDRLLEKDPAQRPQTAGAVETELGAIAAGDSVYFVASPETIGTTTEDVLQDDALQDDNAVETTLLVRKTQNAKELSEELGDREVGDEVEASQPVTLRSWPPSELPEKPYPVLLPYTHPDFMAGRDQEIARLRRLLEMPIPILGLSASSGIGKSSLLLGGLVPALRAAGLPVAVVRHPAEVGVASQLIGDLLAGAEPVADGDAVGFVERLAEVERLCSVAPILVLDQFEDVLQEQRPLGGIEGGALAPRSVLGTLMAASVARRPGLPEAPCRWLIAYRQELYGRLSLWLGDVLADARAAGVAGLGTLPHDLSRPERFHSMTLPPLATPSPGTEDPLGEATEVFLAAIEKPLTVSLSEAGAASMLNNFHFPPDHAERLARAFAEARLARRGAPLGPELQVVLAHLVAEAGPNGLIAVPNDPGTLIDQALDDHLRRALEAAFPADTAVSSTRRARALLALRELATSAGSRDEGLAAEDLARAIGDDGAAALRKLATPLTRLVIVRQAPDGPRWVLAHDRMAEAVVRLVEEEGRHGQLLVDAELLALRRFVTLRTALYKSREVRTSTRVPRRHFRRIEDNADALLWDDDRRAWLSACRQRRRDDWRRLGGLVTLAVVVLTLISWGAGAWARRLAEHQALREQVVQGEPEAALQALDQLAARLDSVAPPSSLQGDSDSTELSLDPGRGARLLALLRKRDVPMDVLEWGLGGLDGTDRSVAVLRAVEIALPWVDETPQDPVLIANLVWALDFSPGRDPAFAERARALRDQVLEPLRRLRPPPPLPGPDDPDWIRVPTGTFLMGTGPDEDGDDGERPQHEVTVSAYRMQRHEVTNVEYRQLVPDHYPDADDHLPAAFITWYKAYTYAAWLGGRLPTEAEWEYAARAGCPYTYCTRDGQEATADAVAWTVQNTGGLMSQPVMQLEPNPWGLYDMLGNLWEWMADGYDEYTEDPERDPWRHGAASGWRLDRGCGHECGPRMTRVAYRFWGPPGDWSSTQGFRVVLPEP